MRARIAVVTAALVAAGAAVPGAAGAHAIQQRADLPIPEWLFGWAAAIVLVLSFVALAALWPEPKLQDGRCRPLPRAISGVLTSRPVEALCGAVGVFLLGLVGYAGLRGVQIVTANIATTFVYVVFWVGLVPLSVLFGDVFKAFNPWRALGRGVAFIGSSAAGADLPPPFAYPKWLGRWPAVVALLIFTALELQLLPDGNKPHTIALAVLAVSPFFIMVVRTRRRRPARPAPRPPPSVFEGSPPRQCCPAAPARAAQACKPPRQGTPLAILSRREALALDRWRGCGAHDRFTRYT